MASGCRVSDSLSMGGTDRVRRSARVKMSSVLEGSRKTEGELDFTSPLLSHFRGIVVESAAALSRSALQTLGNEYCVARWGIPGKLKWCNQITQ